MEDFFNYICLHAHQAHWIIFGLLLLTGFNIPISEDVLVLGAGAIASTCIPDHAVEMYVWVYFGCYLSAWEAYWIGRLLGPHLYKIPFFKTVLTPERLDLLRHYYAKYGIFTFIIGRFCPGGIRNALFTSSGLTKMPFHLFILRDGVACLLSTAIIFNLGYHFAKNFHQIVVKFEHYEHLFLFLTLSLAFIVSIYFWYKYQKKLKD